MTVQTAFHNWQSSPMMPDPRRCSDIGQSWMRYLLNRWGGQNLGCYAARPVVGGTSLSSHASGAAIDWRYQDPGIGRSRMLNEVMPFLIDNSLELGVQAIHDYVGSTIWRPPGQSGRPSQPSPECGWRDQAHGSQMGQSWALWLHIECLNSRWSDTRPVDEMLTNVPLPPDPSEDDVSFTGYWKRDNNDAIFALYSDATKLWINSLEMLDAHSNLMRINGFTDSDLTVNTTNDPNMFAAFGVVKGPRPDGLNEWGNTP